MVYRNKLQMVYLTTERKVDGEKGDEDDKQTKFEGGKLSQMINQR